MVLTAPPPPQTPAKQIVSETRQRIARISSALLLRDTYRRRSKLVCANVFSSRTQAEKPEASCLYKNRRR